MDFNPLSPEVTANPYPYYTELRNKAPVIWLEPFQCWALSRYADVDFALRNPQIFPSSVFTAEALGDLNPVPEVPWILDMNPPDHTRLRKLLFDCLPFSCATERVEQIASLIVRGPQTLPLRFDTAGA